jgi:hypothetical protein
MGGVRRRRDEILAISRTGTVHAMLSGSLRVAVVALWIVVFSNGTLFYIERQVFGLPGRWEGPVLLPAILGSVALGVGLVLVDWRLRGGCLRPVPRIPAAAAVGFGLWATATTWWSLEPAETWWRGVVYSLLPFVAWVIADLSSSQLRRGVGLGTGILVAGSVSLVIAGAPGSVDDSGDWQGTMTNRNSLAPICALAVLVGVSLVLEGVRRSGVLLVTLGVAGLVGSGSRTAVLALTVALVVSSLVTIDSNHFGLQRRSVRVSLLIASGVFIAFTALLSWHVPTFAQRREIWRLVSDHVVDAPLTGKGWGAFWRHPELHDHPLLQKGSAHGSIPDILLGGGVIALVLWLVVVGYALASTGSRAWRSRDTDAWLWFALTLFLVVQNATESFVLWFSYNWVLLIAASLTTGDRRLRAS